MILFSYFFLLLLKIFIKNCKHFFLLSKSHFTPFQVNKAVFKLFLETSTTETQLPSDQRITAEQTNQFGKRFCSRSIETKMIGMLFAITSLVYHFLLIVLESLLNRGSVRIQPECEGLSY